MKPSTAVLAGGIVGIAGAVGLIIYQKQKQCTPQQCPSGQVWDSSKCACVPSSTTCLPQQCPEGQVWSPTSCSCIPCIPQSCPCNQVWDNVLCQCSNLIPAAILVQPQQTAYMPWGIWGTCLFGVQGYGALPQNTQTCPSYAPMPVTGTGFDVIVQGQVVDSASNPICNQTVLIQYSQTDFSFVTNDGNYSGNFHLSGPSSITTDTNGNFSLTFSIDITNVSMLQCNIFQFSSSTHINFPLTISYRIQGTIIQAISVVTLEMLICDTE